MPDNADMQYHSKFFDLDAMTLIKVRKCIPKVNFLGQGFKKLGLQHY